MRKYGPGFIGKKHSPETKLKIRQSMLRVIQAKGHKGVFKKGNKSFLGKTHTPEVRERIRLSKIGKRNPMANRIGALNPMWKGGVTSDNEKFRKTKDYALWRVAVFMRDDYTCQECGEKGGELNADHIKPFSLYPELRLAIDNGRTLCKSCHMKTDTWGGKLYHYEERLVS